MISKIIHFIYPATERTRPWSLVNHAAVMLARRYHPDYKIIIWANKNPEHQYALLDTAQKAGAVLQEIELPTEIDGVKMEHPQYMSDYLRLQILHECGGIYMDTDILTRRSFDGRRKTAGQDGKLVLSWESHHQRSICNALMISPPGNPFVAAWLDALPEALKVSTWAHGGVTLPVELSKRESLADSRKILPHRFACPLDLSQLWLFTPSMTATARDLVAASPAIHVFETYWRGIIKHINRSWIDNTPCLFSDIFREIEEPMQ